MSVVCSVHCVLGGIGVMWCLERIAFSSLMGFGWDGGGGKDRHSFQSLTLFDENTCLSNSHNSCGKCMLNHP